MTSALASTVLPNACIVEVDTARKLSDPRCHLRVLRVSFRDTSTHMALRFFRSDTSTTEVVSVFSRLSLRTPLLGLPKMPLRRSPYNPSTPVRFRSRKTVPLISTATCQSDCTFRSCRSSRLQRFTPGCISRAYCIPQPIMGFTTFPVVSHVCRLPDRAERSRSSDCRVSLI